MANSYREYLKIKKYGGEGGDTPAPTLISKTINANGTYLPEDDQADGYNSVAVNVPEVSDVAFIPPQKFKSNGSALEDYKIFGSDGVITETETSVLPLTFSTVEDKLRDWEIYGNDDVGENLFDIAAITHGYLATNGGVIYSTATDTSDYIAVTAGNDYAIRLERDAAIVSTNARAYGWFDENKQLIGATGAVPFGTGDEVITLVLTAPVNAAYFRFSYDVSYSKNMLVRGSTPPSTYIPYQQGVGQRTENEYGANGSVSVSTVSAICNGSEIAIQSDGTNTLVSANYVGYKNNFSVSLSAGDYGYKIEREGTTTGIVSSIYDSDNTAIGTSQTSGTFTLSADNSVYIGFYVPANTTANGTVKLIITKGSTVPSTYVPYGYEIPISCSGVNLTNAPDQTISLNNEYYKNTFLMNSISEGEYVLRYNIETEVTGYRVSIGLGSTGYAQEATINSAYTDGNVQYIFFSVSAAQSGLNLFARLFRFSNPTTATADISNIMLVKGSTAPTEYIPYFHNDYTFYIGSTPLTAGQSISKTSTGVDIATQVGENTISSTLYNLPETSVTYATSGGVGERVSGSYVIPVKVNSTTTNVPIGDTPLMEDEYVSYAEQKIYRYVEGTLTPVDPPSTLPQITTANGDNELSVVTAVQPDLVQIGLGIPVEIIPNSFGTKTITTNNTYDASDDNLDGYSSVTVNVPNTYVAGDEGKVVSNGALVSQTSATVNQNGTIDTTLINSVEVDVPTGGGSGDVRFLDYDGTVVNVYSAADFANLTALPANPTHEGLTAQGWNWALAAAKTYVASYGKLDIGQMYTTSDGKTRLYVTLDDGRLNPTMEFAVDGTCDIDWGDGTAHTTLTGTSTSTRLTTSHQYATGGDYVIALDVTGSFAFISASNLCILFSYNGSPNDNRSNAYRSIIRKIELGSNISAIGSYAIRNCSNLSSITIPNTITAIGDGAFQNCYGLSIVTVPSNVTTISNSAFYNCYSLSKITIPNDVTTIDDSAFYNCYSLHSVTMPSSVTTIGISAFQNCYSLHSVAIPSGVTTIGSNAFTNCYGLFSVAIPSSVTTISNSVFSSCSSLSSITVPSGVTSIGSSVFSSCYGLGFIEFLSTTPPTVSSSNAFSSVPRDCIIYVPAGTLSDYTSAQNYPSSSNYTYVERSA